MLPLYCIRADLQSSGAGVSEVQITLQLINFITIIQDLSAVIDSPLMMLENTLNKWK